MQLKEFLTIFSTFEDLETIKVTLPTIVEETKDADAALIVHDCSVNDREAIREFIDSFSDDDVFCVFTSPLSQAHSRNLCLDLGIKLFAPNTICCIEDDHAVRPGFIDAMSSTVRTYYGKTSPNGMKYGLFSGCLACWKEYSSFKTLPTGHAYPTIDPENDKQGIAHYGGTNACCHCAPTRHWQAVLEGYDPDEYPISYYQTGHINVRNYHKGFTGMTIAGGQFMYEIPRIGRGHTEPDPNNRPFVQGKSASHVRWVDSGEQPEKMSDPWATSELHTSQLGQDVWVASRTANKADGFFVEIGATDGVRLSNSHYLEKVLGWRGLCIEPNPNYHEALTNNRSCQISTDCVGPRTGDLVEFILAGEYGGISQYADRDLHSDRRQELSTEKVHLFTKSLNDILEEKEVPSFIDYLSIDTEGSEFEILQALDFERWQIGQITVEHNWSRQRSKIYDLLAGKGYSRIEREWDDWYFR